MVNKNFKTVKEIAALLRLIPITIYAYIRTGEIPAVKIGKSYRIEWSEFNKFIKNHTGGIK